MCKYCDITEWNGGIIKVADVPVEINGVEVFEHNLCLCMNYDENDVSYLTSWLDVVDNSDVSEVTVPINYCPFCGRKLLPTEARDS